MVKTQQEWKCFSPSFMCKVCTAARKTKQNKKTTKNPHSQVKKRLLKQRFTADSCNMKGAGAEFFVCFVCSFSQRVRTALNTREGVKSSITALHPPGLARKSLKYVCWQTSNNCRVYSVIYHHPPPPPLFLFCLLFPLTVSEALPICILFAHWFSSTVV